MAKFKNIITHHDSGELQEWNFEFNFDNIALILCI